MSSSHLIKKIFSFNFRAGYKSESHYAKGKWRMFFALLFSLFDLSKKKYAFWRVSIGLYYELKARGEMTQVLQTIRFFNFPCQMLPMGEKLASVAFTIFLIICLSLLRTWQSRYSSEKIDRTFNNVEWVHNITHSIPKASYSWNSRQIH